jgi:uncharacterized phiE125 gp8 family phage protein
VGLKLITPPAVEPIDVAEMKLHLRVEQHRTEEDFLIRSLIVAAREYAESQTGRQLIEATWELSLDDFPCWGLWGDSWESAVELSRPPFIGLLTTDPLTSLAVDPFTYLDSAGVSQVLASTTYEVNDYEEPARLKLAWGQSWPSARAGANAVRIRYRAGFGAKGSDVPESIRQAMKLHVGWLYENREAGIVGTISSQLDFAYQALIQRNKVWRVVA